MRILFIGGTQFIGRHMAAEALARGHEVTLFHLGSGPEDPFPEAEHVHGDRRTGLGVVADRNWDVVIDVCAYIPREVRIAAEGLAGRTERFCYVSTTDVYRRTGADTITEDSPIWNATDLADPDPTEYDWDLYGELKALGEHEALAGFERVTMVRPTYVLGPYDNTDRFPEWIRRIQAGGVVAAPAPVHAVQQLVDARDLAAFTIGLVERGVDGAFNGVAPPTTFGAMLEAVAEGVGADVEFEWLEPDEVAARGLEMPLYNPPEEWEICRCDPSRSAAEGLSHRPLVETVRDTLAWMQD